MTAESAAYHSPLREEQAAATRQRILDAMGALIRREGFDAVSFKALARAAGVTEITVYRHFKDRQALLQEFWKWLNVRLGNRGMPQSEEALVTDLPVVFEAFDEQAPLLRAAQLNPEGHAFRMSVNAQRRAGFERAVAAATSHLTPQERVRVAAVVQLLFSGYAWFAMHEHWDLDGKESGQACVWAIRTLLDRLHRDQQSAAKAKNRGRKQAGKKATTK